MLNQRPISALKTQGQLAPANIKSVQGWLQPPGAGCPEVISSIVAKIEMANKYLFGNVKNVGQKIKDEHCQGSSKGKQFF